MLLAARSLSVSTKADFDFIDGVRGAVWKPDLTHIDFLAPAALLWRVFLVCVKNFLTSHVQYVGYIMVHQTYNIV